MLSPKKKIIIGSRGSELALWQSNHIKALLEALFSDIIFSIEIIKTTGDKILDSPLSLIGGKGLFTAELEEALISKKIDIAVHSLKDLPTVINSSLTIAAIPLRADVRDAFIGNLGNTSIATLPIGATIATGSLRRKAQLLSLRPDLNTIDIRGNVPTRLKKLRDSNWDGMILAAAGLERLSLGAEISEFIDPQIMLPAPGQGALGIQCRIDDNELITLLSSLNDEETALCVSAERTILNELDGGCQLPLGAFAYKNQSSFNIMSCIADPDGSSIIRLSAPTTAEDILIKAKEIANELRKNGGDDILLRLNQTTAK